MNKIIFGIFAHPDDEAFGPAGTLLQETRNGTELHLMTLTDGSAGNNPDNLENLGEVRLEEWRRAGKLLGAKSMEFLGFEDGELNNRTMIGATRQIEKLTLEAISSASSDAEIEFMTLDLNGYTGHIDHIVAARSASQAFFSLQKDDPRFTRIRYACLPAKLYPQPNNDWIYMEAGRKPDEIDEIVDARTLKNDILEVMQAHHSQRDDCAAAIKSQGDDLGLNYFIVKN